MLDRKNADGGYVEMAASARHELSQIEVRLIGCYRQLSKRDQEQLRRLTEALVSNPDQSVEN
ncbi:hypothetical protein H097_27003 [Pseudomonas sp. FH4]|uniref:hypothetical protein n=1 Tax=Pseudomonas sp. FH4 TaxID=1284393 RepID=UPI0003DB825F|nr:hypothetical protein [Pseudomonas sp. FH4]ETK13696.1 hypothetical protein H097_27003 [Pseudomonas sp. FH4]